MHLETAARNTKATCEHIVRVEGVREVEKETAADDDQAHAGGTWFTATGAREEKKVAVAARSEPPDSRISRRGSGASRRIGDPGECRVRLYERNEFQVRGSEHTPKDPRQSDLN